MFRDISRDFACLGEKELKSHLQPKSNWGTETEGQGEGVISVPFQQSKNQK